MVKSKAKMISKKASNLISEAAVNNSPNKRQKVSEDQEVSMGQFSEFSSAVSTPQIDHKDRKANFKGKGILS